MAHSPDTNAASRDHHSHRSKPRLRALAVAVCWTLAAAGPSLFAGPGQERILFDDGWLFTKDDPSDAGDQLAYAKMHDWIVATGNDLLDPTSPHPRRPDGNPGDGVSYTKADFSDAGWRPLTLPHDWGIEGPFKQEYPGETGKLPWWGVGWYRKHFTIPASDPGRRVYLDVDGAMSHAAVWLNGQFVGGWPYGYASWRLDLTPYVKAGGENVLAIRLDNPPDSSRWYPGGGIFRNVWLVKTAPVHVAHWGTYVTTPDISPAAATINLKVTIENNSVDAAEVTVSTEFFSLDDN